MADKVVDGGLAITTNLLSGIGGTVPKYFQMGTGVVAPAHTDTALGTPTNDARVAGTVTRVTTTVTNDTMQVVGTITSGTVGATAVTETSLWDAAGSGSPATGGNMFSRSTFSAVNLNQNDAIQFTAKIAVTSA